MTDNNNNKYVGEKAPFRWTMLGFVLLFYILFLGFANQTFNVQLATITKDMGWTAVQRTAVATAMSSGMVWFVFVAGILMDKFSVKAVYISSIILVAIVLFLRGNAQGFEFWFFLLFLLGVAQAFYMPATNKILSLWFGKSEITFVIGAMTASSAFGQMIANSVGASLTDAVGGWKMMFMIVGVIGFIVAIIFAFVAKDRKNENAALTEGLLKKEDLTFWKNIIGVIKIPQFWGYTIANLCLLGMIYAIGSYAQLVLQTDPHWMIPRTSSGMANFFSNLFSTVSYFVMPIIIMKAGQKHYVKFAVFSGLVFSIAFFVGYQSYNFNLLCIMSALGGISCGAAVPSPKVLMLRHPLIGGERTGTAVGAYTTLERIAITLFTGVIGSMLTVNGVVQGKVLSYAYLVALGSPILILVVALFENARKKKAAAQEVAEVKE